MIKIGVIGAGSMGLNHIRNYHNMDVELVGVADPNVKQLDIVKNTYDTKVFTDYHELLKEGLDAVSIVVPTTMHKDVSINCFSYGIHALVEKPIAESVENATTMIRVAEEYNVRFTVGHIERFNPVITFIKRIIDKGSLGKIVNIISIRVGPHNLRIRDVGIITDLGIHDIDLMNYIYGKIPLAVYTCASCECHPTKDNANILLRYDDNQSSNITTNWLTPEKIRRITIIGTKGVAFGDYIAHSVRAHYNNSEKTYIDTEEPLKLELENFVSCLKTGEDFITSPFEATTALSLVECAKKSYYEEREVLISEDCAFAKFQYSTQKSEFCSD
jgi:UDP-N-acetylglucosamine 3-dehydrogenase